MLARQQVSRHNAGPSRCATARPARVQSRTSRPRFLRARTCIVYAGSQVSTNDFKNGLNIEVDGVPYKVVEFLHVKPGKGSAFVRSKIKNYLTGGVVEKTFRAGEMLNTADMMKREAQYTYSEGDTYIFMDNESYEETRLKKDDEWAMYLKEGMTCELQFYNGKVLSVLPPSFVDLLIVDCPPGVKGNTAGSGGTKPATLETGAVVQVPLFVESGSKVRIDTRTGTYLSKA